MIVALFEVAVNAPLEGTFTYEFSEDLKAGQRVKVPFGSRKLDGVVIGPASDPAGDFEVKAIEELNTEFDALPESYMRWSKWLAKYYFYPLGQILALSLPPLSSKGRRGSRKGSVLPLTETDEKLPLTDEQQRCVDGISAHSGFAAHLLHGVTGSGKTEVYLQLLEAVLSRGQQGLVLVPEISLTPQLIQRFAARFGDQIAVIHSQLTPREKTDQWNSMVKGDKTILVGARSALFCPLVNLGMIIIDEEHEGSFKQEEKLKYHARDAAIVLAKEMNCPIILGSATPSMESWANVKSGKYHLHQMLYRVNTRPLPDVEVVDLRELVELRRERDDNASHDSPDFWLSQPLREAIEETLAANKQVALLLNRRGSAQSVLCYGCGYVMSCPNCDISLTLHGKNHLTCHYCAYHELKPAHCPTCREGDLMNLGLGTEKVEEDLRQLFPEARVARADRDEINSREGLEYLIEAMETRCIDILVGTQMIAKGLDFPHLNLVGLVLADIGLNIPDFRAAERSFQLMVQMSGRSGRHIAPGESPGRVIIQTYNPENAILGYASSNDYEGFSETELEERQQLNYPPFGRLVSLRIQSLHLTKVQIASKSLKSRALSLKRQFPTYKSVEILGPAPAALAKLKAQHRYHMLLKMKTEQVHILHSFCQQLVGDQKWLPSGVRLILDVDPVTML